MLAEPRRSVNKIFLKISFFCRRNFHPDFLRLFYPFLPGPAFFFLSSPEEE